MSREFHVWKAHAADEDSIAPHLLRRFEAGASHCRDDIVLIHAVTTDTYRANEASIFVEGDAARKDLKSVGKPRNVGA